MTFRKGSPRHALAGKVFVVSMLTMGAFAVYLAIARHQPNNIGGGILTLYLIGTAWLTARRRDGETSRFDWVVLLIPLALGILTWMHGLEVVRSGASSWSKAHRTASLAHVLWPVHRGRLFFPGALKPPAEIVFSSGARATSASGFI